MRDILRRVVVFGAAFIASQAAVAAGATSAPTTGPAPAFEAQIAQHGWAYGWTHGADKVFRQDRPFGGTLGGTLKMELAANEYEGVQLVLRSKAAMKKVRVTVSDLAAEGGQKIASSQIDSAMSSCRLNTPSSATLKLFLFVSVARSTAAGVIRVPPGRSWARLTSTWSGATTTR